MKGICRAASGYFAFTLTHLNNGDVSSFVDGNFIGAGLIDGESQVRCIDFESLILVQATHAYQEGAFGKLNLRRII